MVNMALKRVFLILKDVNVNAWFNFVEIVGGYRFGGNSYEIFDKFFGSTNPFVETREDDGRD